MYQNTIKHDHILPKRLQIYQIAEGYCYNSDSLFLWDFTLPHIKHNTNVLELGSGSGIIGLLCARHRKIGLYQVEMQSMYALMNTKNAITNNLDSVTIHADCREIIKVRNALDFLNNNMLQNKEKLQDLLKLQNNGLQTKSMDSQTHKNDEEHFFGKNYAKNHLLESYLITKLPYFDTIISNPPFYHNTLSTQNAIKAKATQSQYLPFETMLKIAKKTLKPNGKFIFCYAPSVLSQVLDMLLTFGFGVEFLRFVHPRLEKDSTLVLICARANSRVQTHILPPLITHNSISQKDNTKEVCVIYKAAHTQSIKVSYNDILWSYLL